MYIVALFLFAIAAVLFFAGLFVGIFTDDNVRDEVWYTCALAGLLSLVAAYISQIG